MFSGSARPRLRDSFEGAGGVRRGARGQLRVGHLASERLLALAATTYICVRGLLRVMDQRVRRNRRFNVESEMPNSAAARTRSP
jgi:hypothetical protein